MSDFAFSDWTQGRHVAHLSTNSGSEAIAFQGWRPFKEAFAPELVAKAISETSAELGRRVLRSSDPFGGSGTTALASQFLGVHATTIEVNPFLADLIEAKLSAYKQGELERAFEEVVLKAQDTIDIEDPFPSAPPTFVEPGVNGRFLFWKNVAVRVAAYRNAIEALESVRVRRFFRVMLGCVVVPVSNVVISGKGRRYRRGWQHRLPVAETVDQMFADVSLRAIYEVQRHQRVSDSYTLLRGDARALAASIGPHEVSVLSPPYPNSFDYTDVYNVELWTLGYLSGTSSNRELRESTLRSHVQIKRSMSASIVSPTLQETVRLLTDREALLWDRNIPAMVAAYFDDMRKVTSAIRDNLYSGGRIYMAVGDSRYAGVDVPVATILCEEALSLGLDVVECTPFRSMRSSPQQGGAKNLSETLVVLRKQ